MATFFADLGKKYRDLLEPRSKIFDTKRAELEVTGKYADSKAEFKANTTFDHDNVSNKFAEKITCPDYGTVKCTVEDTDKPALLELESKKLLKDALKLKLKADVANVELNTKYEVDPVALSLDTKYVNSKGDVTLVPGFVFARSGFLVGGSATLKPQASDGAVDNFSAAVEYSQNDWSAFLKFQQSLANKEAANTVSLSGVYNVNTKTQLGVGADVNLEKPEAATASFGGRYQFDRNLSVLAKVGTSGIANAAFTHTLNSDMQVSIVTEVDVKAMNPTRTGVKLTLGA